jgi:molybdopterin converting factor small subunit
LADSEPDAERARIRVRLPSHLRQLARCEREVSVDAEPTQRGVIDALEASFPGLRGTLREPGSDRRRAFVRFYACEEDLSHEPPDAPLPAPVVEGREPFLVIGAMAGG